MSVRVERTDIAGIGFRDDVITGDGTRVAVLTLRDGNRELAIYSKGDPDAPAASVGISAAESSALAELLGHATLLDYLSGIAEGVAGIFTEQLSLPEDSRFIDHPLGDTKARSKTGVSIVAIARGAELVASPTPNEMLHSGDILVAVGTRSGLDAFSKILADSRT